MGTEMSTALALLVTGMLTVFLVLWLVVIAGNLLIRWVNRFAPDEQNSTTKIIDPRKIAAINAAVEIFTHGTGSVTSIERKE